MLNRSFISGRVSFLDKVLAAEKYNKGLFIKNEINL